MAFVTQFPERYTSVAITIGMGLEFALLEKRDARPMLVLRETNSMSRDCISFGPATKRQIDGLIENLQRLKIHTI